MQSYWVLSKTAAFGIQSALINAFARFRGVRNAITGAVGAFLRQSHSGSDCCAHRICGQKTVPVGFDATPAGLFADRSPSECCADRGQTGPSLSLLLRTAMA